MQQSWKLWQRFKLKIVKKNKNAEKMLKNEIGHHVWISLFTFYLPILSIYLFWRCAEIRPDGDVELSKEEVSTFRF